MRDWGFYWDAKGSAESKEGFVFLPREKMKIM
jgi:hypothetical protein